MSYPRESLAFSALASVCLLSAEKIRQIILECDPSENTWIEVTGSGGYLYWWIRHYSVQVIDGSGQITLYQTQQLAADVLGVSARGLLRNFTVKKVECSKEHILCLPVQESTVRN